MHHVAQIVNPIALVDALLDALDANLHAIFIVYLHATKGVYPGAKMDARLIVKIPVVTHVGRDAVQFANLIARHLQ
jgi:hypothetical protein